MTVATSTFLTDTTLLVRDAIATGVTDPISSTRQTGSRFVMTSYPQKTAVYPLITVIGRPAGGGRHLGQASEGMLEPMEVEVRVWAKNVIQRDQLTQQVYNALRSTQLDTSTGSVENGLFDFGHVGTVFVDEPGDAGIHSAVMTFSYFVILT